MSLIVAREAGMADGTVALNGVKMMLGVDVPMRTGSSSPLTSTYPTSTGLLPRS